MTSKRRTVAVSAGAAALLCLAACGTTVANADKLSTGTTAGSEFGGAPGSSTGVAGGAGSAGLPGAAGGTSTNGLPTGPDSSTGGTGSTGSLPLGASGTNGPGVTATKIYVGMVYARNASVVEVGGLTIGDHQAYGDAFIDDINKHGGVAGRKLVAKWAAFDSASSQTADQQWNSICARFTQDSPRVFAVQGAGTDSFRRCVARAGVIQVDDDLPFADANEFRQLPAFIELGYPNLDRLAAQHVAALADQNYFQPWDTRLARPSTTGSTKVGVLTYNTGPFTTAVDTVLVPALKKLGYTPTVARIGDVDKASDYGSQSAAVQSAELKFASADIDHVISFEGNGGLSLFFMNQAESQHYYPRYGVNTASGTEALIEGGLVSKNQVRGAMGFGWAPGFDVPAANNPDNGRYSNPQRRYCLKVLKDHGIQPPGANAQGVALGLCSSLFLLQKTLNATPKVINQSTFIKSVESLGSAFASAGTLGTWFGPGRHDGASKIYYWRYFPQCGCMNYTGPRRTIP